MLLACQDKLFPGTTFDEKAGQAAAIGFDALEITPRAESPLRETAPRISAALARHGVAAAAVCGGYRGWLGHFDAETRQAAVRDISEMLPIIADIGAQGIVVPAAFGMFSRKLPPFTPPRTAAEDRVVLLASLRAIAEAAEKAGVRIYLEPLNRYEDHMLNTLAQACELARAVGSPSVMPMIDVFHASIEETDLPAAIRAAGAAIGHVHLADSDRFEPGHGHTDFAAVLAALRDTGFQGYGSLECALSSPAALARSLAVLTRV